MSPLLRIELFGGLRVVQGELVTDRFATQKAAARLAYLAYHAGQSHSRELLISLFWSESEPASGRNSLSTALWSLRRLLNTQNGEGEAILSTDRTSVCLTLDRVSIDVIEFATRLSLAEHATDPNERIQLYSQTLRLYHAPLLQGLYDGWIATEQELLNRRFSSACQQLAQLYSEAADFDNAIEWAGKVVEIDTFHEETHLQLMRLFVLAGRTNDAILHYQEMERLFKKELAISPSKEMHQYIKTIQDGYSASNSPAAITPSLSQEELPSESKPPEALEGGSTDSIDSPVPKQHPRFNKKVMQVFHASWVVLLMGVLFVAFKTQGASPHAIPKNESRREQNTSSIPRPKAQIQPPPKAPPASQTALPHSNSPLPFLPTQPISGFMTIPLPKPKPTQPKVVSEGREMWAQRYESLEDEKDSEPSSVKTDTGGNVYVCGFVQTLHNDVDFLVLKYAPSGQLLWRQRWNGPGNDCDRARCMALDSQGSVYVIGESYNGDREKGGRDWDFALVKFDTKGVKQWERLYNGGKWDDDRPIGVCVDAEDKVYMGGVSRSPEHKAEYVLLKYDGEGRMLLPQPNTFSPYTEAHPDADVGLEDFTLDAKGNLYLTAGIVYHKHSATNYLITAKYDYHGNLLWMRRFSGEVQCGDKAKKITLDKNGNIYVAGMGFHPPFGRAGTGEDMFVVKYDPAGVEQWKVYAYDKITPGVPDGLAVDSQGDVVVTGFVGMSGQAGLALKYNSEGKLLWQHRFNGHAMSLHGATTDANNNVCVIGWGGRSNHSKPLDKRGDMVTTKYSPKGALLWQRVYRGPTDDYGRARAYILQKDTQGSLFSVGQSAGRRHLDIVIVKYSP